MPIFSNKAPSPHHNFQPVNVRNLGAIPDWQQTTGKIPGTAPVVEIPPTGGYFGNPKAALASYPTIFTLTE